MKWLASGALTCLIGLSSVTLGSSSHIVSAGGLRYKSVRLESLPLVQADSVHANILTPAAPGHYRDMTINSGVQFSNGGGCGGAGTAEFHLGGGYDELVGTLYNEDKDTSQSTRVIVYDTSNPNNKRSLFGQDVPGLGQVRLHLQVRGINYLAISGPSIPCWATIDVVAQLTSGTLPPTQVVPRFPTGNAGVPAGSKALFGWQPFPHATNYALHIWLTGLSGSATVTGATPLTFAATIHHKTSYTWNDQGFLPGTYQYSLLPLDDSGHNLAGWSTPTQITIASS